MEGLEDIEQCLGRLALDVKRVREDATRREEIVTKEVGEISKLFKHMLDVTERRCERIEAMKLQTALSRSGSMYLRN